MLFWELDQQGVLEWYESVEVEILNRLAHRMLQHIQQRFLPHFFITKINLLDELTQTDFEQVERLMQMVSCRVLLADRQNGRTAGDISVY